MSFNLANPSSSSSINHAPLTSCIKAKPFRDHPSVFPIRRCRSVSVVRPCAHGRGNYGDAPLIIIPRRTLLTGLTIGGAYAWASRNSRSEATTLPTGSEEVLKSLEERLTEFTLPTGLHFLVLERHTAPIVSCETYANVGAYNEKEGQTGIAHLLEHMAFKGTPRVGTRDFVREQPLLDAMDEVFYELRDARQNGRMREEAQLLRKLQALQAESDSLSVPNEFGSLLQRAGALGLNAVTSHDSTRYYLSLPANKLELWFALEAERFQAPVFRALYSEKQVVAEERRLRIDNAPLGKFSEQFSLSALGNNYRRPVIGFPEDVDAIGRKEITSFFREYYGPTNLTISIVGDVSPEQVRSYAEKYFGGWRPSMSGSPTASSSALSSSSSSSPSSSSLSSSLLSAVSVPLPPAASPPPSTDTAKPTSGDNVLRGSSKAGPILFCGYYRPSLHSRQDDVTLDVISDLLSGTRTSLLYRNVVQTGKAVTMSTVAAYPADRHPCMFFGYGVPSKDVSLENLLTIFKDQTNKLGDGTGVTDKDLQRVKKGSRVDLLNALLANSSMAGALCGYHAATGSWKTIADELQRLEMMGTSDVKTVAQQTFRDDNMFVGYVNKA